MPHHKTKQRFSETWHFTIKINYFLGGNSSSTNCLLFSFYRELSKTTNNFVANIVFERSRSFIGAAFRCKTIKIEFFYFRNLSIHSKGQLLTSPQTFRGCHKELLSYFVCLHFLCCK